MNEKQLTVITGPSYNPQVQQVILNGIEASDKLTPKMARQAVHAARYSYPATVWDKEHGYGYRVYAKSAHKITEEE